MRVGRRSTRMNANKLIGFNLSLSAFIGGWVICLWFSSILLVVILKIQINNLTLGNVDAERQSPVARYVQAPQAFTVAGQGVRLPAWKRSQFVRVFHLV